MLLTKAEEEKNYQEWFNESAVRVIELLPEMYRAVVKALIRESYRSGKIAVLESLHEKFHPKLDISEKAATIGTESEG